jgi:hypothetical protein
VFWLVTPELPLSTRQRSGVDDRTRYTNVRWRGTRCYRMGRLDGLRVRTASSSFDANAVTVSAASASRFAIASVEAFRRESRSPSAVGRA